MKKIFFAMMVVAAIAMVGCEERHQVNDPDDPDAPENDRNHNIFLDDTIPFNQPNTVPMRMPLSTRE